MGLERTLAVINHLSSVFETELFVPIIKKIEEISNKKYEDFSKEFRIVADHLKASIFLLAERLEPSNVERGYILRRLIRRAIRFGRLLGIKDFFAFKLVEPVLTIYGETYPELKENKDFIEEQLVREEEKFSKTLSKGLGLFERLAQSQKAISGKEAFDLYQSYWLSIGIN